MFTQGATSLSHSVSGTVAVDHAPIADCADLVIVPTLTRHASHYGRFLLATSAQSCPGTRLHSGARAQFRVQDSLAVADARYSRS